MKIFFRNLLFIAFGMGMLAHTTAAYSAQPYFGVSYALPDWDTRNFGDVTPPTALLKLGGSFGAYLGLEGRLGLAIGDDDEWETDNYAGAFIRVNFIPPESKAVPHFIVGYHNWKVEASFGGEADESGGTLGLGIDIKTSDAVSLNFEYMRWFKNVDTLAVGLNVLF